jgi:hypothetical protein
MRQLLQMKILVQDPDTKRFYKRGGRWTEKADDAEVFDDAVAATMLCNAEQIYANLVVEFPGSGGEKVEIPYNFPNFDNSSVSSE